MTSLDLACVLTLHFIGDFILQSNWMALGKSKHWRPLTAHALAYCVPFVSLVFVRTVPDALVFLGLTFATHWVTDYFTSRVTSRLWFVRNGLWELQIDHRKRHWFFVAIGFDQLIHMWTLFVCWRMAFN